MGFGLSLPPQLWGTERAEWILDLNGTSNAEIACLEITDRSSCALSHCNPSVACPRSAFPYGDYADEGIRASDSSHVTLRDLDIHGLAWAGVHAGRLTDWTVERVRVAGNGGAGWDGDLGEDSSNSGTLHLRNFTVEWNGCPETYPGLQPDHCWGQETCGGYGDGVGLARSGGHFVLEDSLFRYNVSDGLDLLYVGVDHPDAVVEVYRSQAYGNAGNQMKIGGTSRLVNCLIASDCAFFFQKPFGQEMGELHSGDHCRAGGAGLSINLPRGRSAYVVNSTLASQGWAVAELQCNNLDFPDQPPCDGTERVYLANDLFQGYPVVYLDYPRLTDIVGDGDPYHFTTAETVDYNLIHDCLVSSPTGPHTLDGDPLFEDGNLASLDAHLQAGSPAIGQGLPIGSLGGLVPPDDLEGLVRTDPPDLGAYQYNATPGCTLSCSASVPASAAAGTAVPFTALATPRHCTGEVAFHWDFGDGSGAPGASVSHAYGEPGSYTWHLTASVDTAACTRSGILLVQPPVTPPTITAVTKGPAPFKLRIGGTNFQEGVSVFLGSDTTPWSPVTRKGDTLLVVKGGNALKARFPRGQPVSIRVRNPDGGEATATYTRP
ncbi:MAG: PKD domain-containing protein [Acidobacteriota bacterium]